MVEKMNFGDILDYKKGERHFLLGNEAIARGALESGVNVFTHYPGTPSSEIGTIFNAIFRKSALNWVESSINEKVAMEIAGGAYARGAKAMVAMKNVGLNVASDPLFALSTSKPDNPDSALVIVVADDPQAHSSAIEMDSRNYLHLFKIPALEPSDPQECLEFTKKAFEISRELKLPTILRTVTMVAHARSNVLLGEIKSYTLPKKFSLSKEFNVASRFYFINLKDNQIYDRMNRALKLSEESRLNQIIEGDGTAQLGIITSGVSYHYVKEAFEYLNLSIPILKLGFIYPFPMKKIIKFLKRFKEVLIVEEMDAFIENQVLAVAQVAGIRTKVYGKAYFYYSKEKSLLSLVGELNPTKVTLALSRILKDHISPNLISDLEPKLNEEYATVKRLPVMCAGCPHRTTGYALSQLVNNIKSNRKTHVHFHQDIGCYTMLSYPPLGFANVKYCMGSSIATAQGVAHTSDDLNISIIGDGTFLHSGIPALINAVHNKTPILILILDNGWIGMTGQQPHPGSNTENYEGGEYKEKIDLEKLIIGIGANVSVVRHEYNDSQYFQSLRNLILEKSNDVLDNYVLQVILIKDECIQKVIKRRKPELRVINQELCTTCSLCYNQLACPAINQENGKVIIDMNSCLGCGICEEICPSGAISKEGE
jgi:indolepyruvate ferredoxin oxidoreductase alpha subunit